MKKKDIDLYSLPTVLLWHLFTNFYDKKCESEITLQVD